MRQGEDSVPTNVPPGDGSLRFDLMIDGALRSVVRQAISHVVTHGLPGTHHFYLTFRTGQDGVEIPNALRAAHPDEMTIVLQNQFWDLRADEEAFEVTLSFNRIHHRLRVPFAALTSFADPSVQFGLQFQAETARPEDGADLPADGESDPAAAAGEQPAETPDPPAADDAAPEAEGQKIVTLDMFRKK